MILWDIPRPCPKAVANQRQRLEIRHMQKRPFHSRFVELAAPSFLFSLAVLLLNDFWWKGAFHNAFTGKISDFAGLFAFAWFGMTILQKGKWKLMLGIGLFFIWWKSSLSQGFIESWNSLSLLPINRVVDYTDLMALVSLPLAAMYFGNVPKKIPVYASPIFKAGIFTLSIFAFCATSYMDNLTYDKVYDLNLSLDEAIAGLNTIDQENDFGNPFISPNHENANDFVDEGNYRLYFHHNDQVITAYDTVFGEVDDSIFVDQIHPFTIPIQDTIYVSPEGLMVLKFDIPKTEKEEEIDEGCEGIRAIVRFKEKGKRTLIELLEIKVSQCPEVGNNQDLGQGEYLQERFEFYFIKPLEGKKK